MDWSKYAPYFTADEFICQETAEHGIREEFLDALLKLRIEWGRPMKITSGYRSPKHSIELRKNQPGPHTTGMACDVALGPGAEVWEFIYLAMQLGFTGIGVSQKSGRPRFIHLDLLAKRLWSY